MSGKSGTSAMTRLRWRAWPLLALYIVLLFAVDSLLRTTHLAEPLKYAAAILPAVPMVGIIVALGLYLAEEADEFLRVQLVQAMLWGLGVTLTLTTAWGLLEDLAGAPRLPLTWVFPIFCAGMGLARRVIRRWYR